MKSLLSVMTAAMASLLLVASAWADTDPGKGARGPEKLGRVLFKTSCSPTARSMAWPSSR